MTIISSPTVRLILADDYAMFRQGLRALLQLQERLLVVAEVEPTADLDAIVAATPADILLLDPGMERDALPEIRRLSAHINVIIVTASEQTGDALAAIGAGARAVVCKRAPVETLLEAIASVLAGNLWMPSVLRSRLASELRDDTREWLTAREREIVHYVALGMRNAEVGQKLFISEQTVKTHLSHIFRKLHVRERVELTLYAVRAGIVGTGERRA